MGVWWCAVVLFVASSNMRCVSAMLCDPPGSLSVYEINPTPSGVNPLTNNGTPLTSMCQESISMVGRWSCNRASVIFDGDLGFQPSPSSAPFFAWSRSSQSASVLLRYIPAVTIRHVRLFFYNKPSMGIGLPDVRLTSGGTQLPHYITGNEDLHSDDDGRRDVTLSLISHSPVFILIITFDFSDAIGVNWLLLSEVQICQQPTTVLRPSVAPALVTAPSVVRSASDVCANLYLSCTVSGEGRFKWEWTGPSPASQSILSDYTRTSTILFTGIKRVGTTKYRCQATYDPQITNETFAMAAFQDLDVQLEFQLVVVGESSVKAALLDQVSLTCELYGYLENSDIQIIWARNNADLQDSDPLYDVVTRNGNRSIQNGGNDSMPSIISVLSISANDTSVFVTYTCKVKTTVQVINLVRMETTITDMVTQPGTTPLGSDTQSTESFESNGGMNLTILFLSGVCSFLVGLLCGALIGVGIVLVHIRLTKKKSTMQLPSNTSIPLYETIDIPVTADPLELQLEQNISYAHVK